MNCTPALKWTVCPSLVSLRFSTLSPPTYLDILNALCVFPSVFLRLSLSFKYTSRSNDCRNKRLRTWQWGEVHGGDIYRDMGDTPRKDPLSLLPHGWALFDDFHLVVSNRPTPHPHADPGTWSTGQLPQAPYESLKPPTLLGTQATTFFLKPPTTLACHSYFFLYIFKAVI